MDNKLYRDPLERRNMKNLSAIDAVQILEILECEDDPIVFKNEDTSPRDLVEFHLEHPNDVKARDVRIIYYTTVNPRIKRDKNRVQLRRGTLSGMLRERLGV